MRENKGISLIVLIITIIVMIIIAGAIILTLTNTNIIDQAEQAKEEYNLSQVKASVELERYNALLSRYNTTEEVNISVKSLLGLTDSDAINIGSATTIPKNMPEGKYYELNITRYGIEDTGTIANGIMKNTYVINDNYDIYYVIEETVSEVELEIDDAKVIQILTEMFSGSIDETIAVTELKDELYISKDAETIFDLLIAPNTIDNESCMYYFYENLFT